jgi:hypothetical protein
MYIKQLTKCLAVTMESENKAVVDTSIITSTRTGRHRDQYTQPTVTQTSARPIQTVTEISAQPKAIGTTAHSTVGDIISDVIDIIHGGSILVNAASSQSLGSADCPSVPDQTLANMGHLAGAPKGPDGIVPCGKQLTIKKNGRQTTVTIAWQATGILSFNPNKDPYVEIFPEAYTELTGNQVIDGVFWQEGSFWANCFGTCSRANGAGDL